MRKFLWAAALLGGLLLPMAVQPAGAVTRPHHRNHYGHWYQRRQLHRHGWHRR